MKISRAKRGRGRGRPREAFPRSADGAYLFNELRRRGLTWDVSMVAVYTLLGVSKSKVEKYRKSPVKPANASTEQMLAAYAVSKHWEAFIRPRLMKVPASVQMAIREIVSCGSRKTEDRPS